jgi:Protein of unknown function (DUF1573)
MNGAHADVGRSGQIMRIITRTNAFGLVIVVIAVAVGANRLLARPIAAFDSSRVDVGTVVQGQVISHDFTVVNTGRAELTITDVHPACWCTATVVSKAVLAPHEAGSIRVNVDTSHIGSDINAGVIVDTNATGHRQIALTITGKVVRELDVSEPWIDFGTLRPHDTAVKDIVITVAKAISVTSVRSTDDAVSAEIINAREPSETRAVTLHVKWLPTATTGAHAGVLVVDTTSRYRSELRIPIRGFVMDRAQQTRGATGGP